MPLTDTEIRKAKSTTKPLKLFDGLGLFLLVTPAGGKWWRLKYRHAGKEKLLSLGTYPEVPLKLARERRDDARKQIAEGADPSAARRSSKDAQRAASARTLEAVARKWLAHRSPAWTAGTSEAITASLENHVFPTLGAKAISEIKPAELRDAVQAVEATGASETAGRVFQRIRSVYRYAVAHELVEIDPTYALKAGEILKPRKPQHRAALSERELPGFLAKLDAYEGSPVTRNALELLMLTAVRPGELRGARWSEFDEAGAAWRIPAERMKMRTEHVVPLSSQALEVVRQLHTLTGEGDLLFPSPFYPGKPLSDGTLNSALARMGYKGTATAHGFRSLFSTCANEAGWKGDLIEKQLAHEERDDVRAAYNRAQYIEERARLMQWWGDQIARHRRATRVQPLRAA